MPIPLWVLLGFAAWTLLSLVGSVGVYRWSRIVSGDRQIKSFRADQVRGDDWYKRAMRAHANCVENLPVYGAVVLAIVVTGVDTRLLDILAIVLLIARVVHTFVHISFEQTNLVASFRFAFYFVQVVCMFWMGVNVSLQAM